jgi:hypothetical protein
MPDASQPISWRRSSACPAGHNGRHRWDAPAGTLHGAKHHPCCSVHPRQRRPAAAAGCRPEAGTPEPPDDPSSRPDSPPTEPATCSHPLPSFSRIRALVCSLVTGVGLQGQAGCMDRSLEVGRGLVRGTRERERERLRVRARDRVGRCGSPGRDGGAPRRTAGSPAPPAGCGGRRALRRWGAMAARVRVTETVPSTRSAGS